MMAKGRPGCSLRDLRGLFAGGTAVGLTDGELLERYVTRRMASIEAATEAESAFTALVDRHGAMVWGVCRRVLGDTHEAEDAFQATFLVLVRRAGSVRVDGSLGRWLYGVAHRVALRARSEAGRRATPIDRDPPRYGDDPAAVAELRDLRGAVAEELDRLPSKYRCPIELCDLQGLTYEQAARRLGWPLATVKSRLARGRSRLRERLSRRGLGPVPAEAGLAALLTRGAPPLVPAKLVLAAARGASPGAAFAFPTAVTQLTDGVLKMMMWQKLRVVAVASLVAAGLAARGLSQQTDDRGTGTPSAPEAPPRQAHEPTRKPGGDRRWVRSLSNGAIIEVVGISSLPAGPDTWWRPDGTPMRQAPCDPGTPSSISGDHCVPKLIVVRLARIPRGADYQWSIAESMGGAQGDARRDGKSVPGLSEATVLLPEDARTCTIRFEVAAGPWETVQKWGKNAGGVSRRDGPSCIFGGAIASGEGTTLAVTHDIREKSVRIIAVTNDGEEVSADVRSGTGVKDFHQVVVAFDQPPDRIKEFRLQTRSYERVEIPRIPHSGPSSGSPRSPKD